jgi:hypothetical protein
MDTLCQNIPSIIRRALLLAVILLALWLPRGLELDRFVATDEVAWLWRSANFYYALGQRDFAATDLNRSPGVVTMWVDTIAYLVEFPQYRGLGQGLLDKYAVLEEFLLEHGVHPHDILVTARKWMVLLNVGVLVVAFWLARRLFGLYPTLIGFLLIAFDPYHAAVTRLAHLDGPLSSFMFLSLMAFLVYLYQGKHIAIIVLSAVSGGLAVLAKIPGLLLPPTVGLLGLLDAWQMRSELRAQGHGFYLWRTLIKPGLIWGAVFLLTMVAFYPALWVQPVQSGASLALSPFKFVGKVARNDVHQSDNGGELSLESGDAEVFNGILSRPMEYFLRYPEKYLWHSTPITLLGLMAAFIALLRQYTPFHERKIRQATSGLILFTLIYTLCITIPPKSSSKYYLPVYPVLSLIAGMGWYALAERSKSYLPKAGKKIIPALALVVVVLLQAQQCWSVHPYYLTYLNPWMAANPQARENLSMGSGEGLDLAAAYLNQKPGAVNLHVLSWYGTGPFSFYFVGYTEPIRVGSRFDHPEAIRRLKDMDYLVVYSNQWQRQIPGGLFPLIEGVEPEKRIFLNGIEYVRIYNVEAIPEERFTLQP